MKFPVSKTLAILAIVKGIFVMSMALSLLLWSIPVLSFNSDIWNLFQKRSGVTLDVETAKSYNELIIEFFKSGLKLDFLDEAEFSHMKDVRNVITVLNFVFAFSFLLLITNFIYFPKSRKRFLIQATRKTSLVVFGVTLVVSIVVLTNFYKSFFLFHEIIFIRNFIFPAESILKTLYPDEFFFGLSAVYLLSILIVSGVVAVASHRLKLK